MGEMADYYSKDLMYDIDLTPNYDEYDFKVWKTKDGQRIPINKMDTDHIKNCINFLSKDKKNSSIRSWVWAFTEELRRRKNAIPLAEKKANIDNLVAKISKLK